MSNLKDTFYGDHDKWSITINSDLGIVIRFNLDRQPNFGEIVLTDGSAKDFRALGEMFLSLAQDLEDVRSNSDFYP